MEEVNLMSNTKKEPEEHFFDPPPYCQRVYPCIHPLVDDCVHVPLRLEVSDATKLMYFMENLNGVTTTEIEYDINTYLKKVCKASDVFIIHIMRISQQGRVIMLTERVLETKVIMPLNINVIDSLIRKEGDNFICKNAVLHPEIRRICRKVLGRKGDPMIVVPILSRCRRNRDEKLKLFGNPIALVCLINCEETDRYVLKTTQELFRYCTTTLLNTMEGEEEANLRKNSHLLLEGSRKLFQSIHDLGKLIKEIMSSAKDLTNAERCCLFLMDPDHLHWVSKVFSPDPKAGMMEVRIAIDQAISAHVAATGKTLNISNPQDHPLFYRGEDKIAGTKTRNILCFPIRDEKDMLIGVGQVSNKRNGSFDIFDEQIVEAFSMNCGVSLMHSLMYGKMEEIVKRNRMAQEIMLYKTEITMDDVAQVLCCKTVHKIKNFDTFEFDARSIIVPETVCYVMKMFEDLEYMTLFRIRDITLIKFFLTVKSMYGERPYRNWHHHGFATGHFVYCLLKQLNLVENRYVASLEGLALLISAFCHDIDRQESTNPNILYSKNILANFYTSENMARTKHSVNQTLTILSMNGCNILESLNDTDFKICIDLIKDLIYATDLTVHLKLQFKQKKICTEKYDNMNVAHRYYLCSLIMTSADLSDFVKEWMSLRSVVWYLFQEFLMFGDLEKQNLKKPAKNMDRDDIRIPELLVEFMNEICRPVFNILSTLFPITEVLKLNLEDNIEIWKKCSNYFFEQEAFGFKPLDVLLSDGLDIEAEAAKREVEAVEDDEEEDGVTDGNDNDSSGSGD